MISRGRAVFEAAMANPDSLADADLEGGEVWEEWDEGDLDERFPRLTKKYNA